MLALHGVFLFGVFLADFVDFRFQHAHLGAAHITLARGGVHDDAQEERDEQEHDAHRQVHAGEEVEDVEREVAVDPFEERPAEVHEVLQLILFCRDAEVVHRLQEAVVVRAEIILEVCGLRARGVDGRFHLGGVGFQVTRLLVELLALDRHVLHRRGCDEHGTEILVFEGNPVDARRHAFLLGLLLGELFHVVVGSFVGERGIHVFKIETLFVARHAVVPGHVEGRAARLAQVAHARRLQGAVEQVVVGEEPVNEADALLARLRGKREGDGGVSHVLGRKAIICKAHVALFGFEHEVEAGIFL